MEIPISGLFFLALFIFYILSENGKEDLKNKRAVLEQQKEIERLRAAQSHPQPPAPHIVETIREKPIYIPFPVPMQQPPQRQPQQFLPAATQFVKVIFRPDDDKSYDYLLGNHHNIKVGDFVKVWTSQGKNKTVQVVYISGYGEVSAYAKTVIEGKTRRPQWWH